MQVPRIGSHYEKSVQEMCYTCLRLNIYTLTYFIARFRIQSISLTLTPPTSDQYHDRLFVNNQTSTVFD
jgi:hypothetical protein